MLNMISSMWEIRSQGLDNVTGVTEPPQPEATGSECTKAFHPHRNMFAGHVQK